MSSVFLFFWSLGLPCYLTNYYTIPDNCTLRLSDYRNEIRLYDANDYLICSENTDEPAWIIWLENPSSYQLFVDSCHILLEITDCINPNINFNLESDSQLPTLVCFYSISQNSAIHSKRVELLQKACFNLPIRLLFVQQEFPRQMYFENLSSDE